MERDGDLDLEFDNDLDLDSNLGIDLDFDRDLARGARGIDNSSELGENDLLWRPLLSSSLLRA